MYYSSTQNKSMVLDVQNVTSNAWIYWRITYVGMLFEDNNLKHFLVILVWSCFKMYIYFADQFVKSLPWNNLSTWRVILFWCGYCSFPVALVNQRTKVLLQTVKQANKGLTVFSIESIMWTFRYSFSERL